MIKCLKVGHYFDWNDDILVLCEAKSELNKIVREKREGGTSRVRKDQKNKREGERWRKRETVRAERDRATKKRWRQKGLAKQNYKRTYK